LHLLCKDIFPWFHSATESVEQGIVIHGIAFVVHPACCLEVSCCPLVILESHMSQSSGGQVNGVFVDVYGLTQKLNETFGIDQTVVLLVAGIQKQLRLIYILGFGNILPFSDCRKVEIEFFLSIRK
jgi:hypothetical protein